MHEAFDPTEGDICVVDDDPSLLDSIQKLLALAGLAARVFDKPEAFLTYIAANHVSWTRDYCSVSGQPLNHFQQSIRVRKFARNLREMRERFNTFVDR